MSETVRLTLEPYDRFEIGGRVLATMLLPDASAAQRDRTATSVASYLAWHAYNGSDDAERRAIPKKHLHLDMKTAEHGVRVRRKALRNRVTAGRMGVPLLMEAEMGIAAPRAPGAPDNSLNQLARYALPDSGITLAHDLEKRAWRASRGVVHLCCAYVVTVQNWQRQGWLESAALEKQFANEAFVVSLLYAAMEFEGLLEKSRLHINPETLVRLRSVH